METSTRRASAIQEFYDRFVTQDWDWLRERLHPDVEFINPLDAVEPGTRSGVDAFVRAVSKVHEIFDYDGAEVVELTGRGDRVVALVRFLVRGQGSDVPVDAQFAHLLSWDGDRLRRFEWFRDRDEAVAALA